LFVSTLLIAGTVTAADATSLSVDDLDQDRLDDVAEQYYTAFASQLPGLIASVIADERINVYIETEDGEAVYGVVLDGTNVSGLQTEAVADPTLRIYTSMDTIGSIAESENPKDRAVAAFKSDEIRYEAVGFFRRLTFGVVSILITLFG
jgi:hypothetical protein